MNPEGSAAGLREEDLTDDPYEQFAAWLADVRAAELPEPDAMVVATADAEGRPSARHVLLRSFDQRGFVFYTNYGSRKGTELAANPYASLVFPWFPIRRQVVVCGPVERVDRAESAAYFATRPRGAQIGAWASQPSAVIASRAWLDERVADVERRFPGEVPLPDFWGGFRVVPTTIEFWCGRTNRLHDRLQYRRNANGWDTGWTIERLSP